MNVFKDDLREQDEVYCIINPSIEGRITKRTNCHGIYLYHIEVKDEKSFRKHFGLNSVNVMFLHWQLKKFLKGGQK